ncbi:MAG: tetratricopeptide repeat protein [Phycisphaerales bacterium]|nr:tetratricopeptide repeat protein [Phycisphaerales bacterium]
MTHADEPRAEAMRLCEEGEFRAALKILEGLERRHREALGKDHPEVANDIILMGMLHEAQGTAREAFTQYARALKIQEKAFGADDLRLVPTLAAIGFRMLELDDLEGAHSVFVEVERLDRLNLGDGHPDVARDLRTLAEILQDLGEDEEAAAALREAAEIDRGAEGGPGLAYAEDLVMLSDSLRALKDPGEAAEIRERLLGPEHTDLAEALLILGRALRDAGRLEDALAALRRAEAIDRLSPDAEDGALCGTLNCVGIVLAMLGRFEEAKTAFEESFVSALEADLDDDERVVEAAVNLRRWGGDPAGIARARRGEEWACALDEAMEEFEEESGEGE